jgi:hypothetical protein
MIRGIDAAMRVARPTYVTGRGWVDDEACLAVAQVLQDGFDRLARLYGPDVVGELSGWLVRNEANWSVKEAWWSWWLWLSSLAGDAASRSALGAHSKVDALFATVFADHAEAAYARRELQAGAIHLSAFERRLLAHEVGLGEAEAAHDVIASMRLARIRERARFVVLTLATTLDPSDWQQVLALKRSDRGSPRAERERHSLP